MQKAYTGKEVEVHNERDRKFRGGNLLLSSNGNSRLGREEEKNKPLAK